MSRFEREYIEINYPVRKLLVPKSDEIVGVVTTFIEGT